MAAITPGSAAVAFPSNVFSQPARVMSCFLTQSVTVPSEPRCRRRACRRNTTAPRLDGQNNGRHIERKCCEDRRDSNSLLTE